MKGYSVRLTYAFALGAGALVAEPVWDLGTFTTTAPPPPESPFASLYPLGGSTVSTGDALIRIPGMAASEGFGGIDPPRVSVRGSGLQSAPMSRGLLLFVDGVPLNFADGSFHLPLLEPRFFDEIALDLRPAPTALGGRLDWSMSRSLDDYSRISLSAGSNGTYAGLLSLSEALDDPESGFTGAFAHLRSDGWREQADYERTSAYGRIYWNHGRNRSRLQLYASNPRFAVPGPLAEEAARQAPTTVSPTVQRDKPYRKTEYIRLAHTTSLAWSREHVVEATVTAAGVDDRFVQLLPNGITRNCGYEALTNFTWSHLPDGSPVGETRLTAQLALARREALRFRNDGGREGMQIGDNVLRPLTLSGGVRQRVMFSPTLEAVLQMEGILSERRLAERFPTTAQRPSTALNLREKHVAPRIDLIWHGGFGTYAALALSRQYEAPTFDDLLFTAGPTNARWLKSAPLRSQRADTVDGILRGDTLGNRWSLSLYESRWRGELLRMVDGEGNARGTVNAGHTRRRGATIAIERTVYEKMDTALRLWTHYSWQALRFDNDPVYGNRRLAGAAPHTFAGGVEVETFGGAYFHLGGRGTSGRIYVDHMNRRAYGGSFIAFLQAGVRVPGAGSISLRIDNLFDRRHLASTAGVLDRVAPGAEPRVFLPGSPRRFLVDFSHSW